MKVETSISPRGYHVLIRPMPLQETSDGGIILSNESTSYGKLQKAGRSIGHVVAIGSQCWRSLAIGAGVEYEPWASIGDKVVYGRYSGSPVEDPISEEEYFLVRDTDIISVFEDSTVEVEINAKETDVIDRR